MRNILLLNLCLVCLFLMSFGCLASWSGIYPVVCPANGSTPTDNKFIEVHQDSTNQTLWEDKLEVKDLGEGQYQFTCIKGATSYDDGEKPSICPIGNGWYFEVHRYYNMGELSYSFFNPDGEHIPGSDQQYSFVMDPRYQFYDFPAVCKLGEYDGNYYIGETHSFFDYGCTRPSSSHITCELFEISPDMNNVFIVTTKEMSTGNWEKKSYRPCFDGSNILVTSNDIPDGKEEQESGDMNLETFVLSPTLQSIMSCSTMQIGGGYDPVACAMKSFGGHHCVFEVHVSNNHKLFADIFVDGKKVLSRAYAYPDIGGETPCIAPMLGSVNSDHERFFEVHKSSANNNFYAGVFDIVWYGNDQFDFTYHQIS